jgi:hypothetical protein
MNNEKENTMILWIILIAWTRKILFVHSEKHDKDD